MMEISISFKEVLLESFVLVSDMFFVGVTPVV